MSTHTATIRWSQKDGDDYPRGRYSRVHEIAFDGGVVVEASGAPQNVPAQFSSSTSVDPEELFVASLASCHMLWFLDLSRRAGVEILSYEDQAEGLMAKNAAGRTAIVKVTLRPKIEVKGDAALLPELHHKAHEACFIANSVTTEVVVEPRGDA